MDRKPRTDVVAGISIPAEQRTALVEMLLRELMSMKEEIRKLKDEVNRLRGHSERPDIKPSSLGGSEPPSERGQDKQGNKARKRKGKKRPGSAKRNKTAELRIDDTVIRHPENLPEGAMLEGYQDYVVQDLEFRSRNVKYRLAKFKLPDGTYVHGKLPDEVDGHFGKNLQCYILHQYYHSHVTQPAIRQQLLDIGVDISVGQISRILTEGHDAFHGEKDQLLPTALDVSSYVNVDDTGSRHRGRNGYCTHIGNQFFASFTSTSSKSRVNFLEILQSPCEDYVLDGDAIFFMECQDLSQTLLDYVKSTISGGRLIFTGRDSWAQWLARSPIEGESHRRIATEGALWASLMYHDTVMNQVLISDDAGQFKILGLLNGLCWVHAERAIDRLVPVSEAECRAKELVQDRIWEYYQRLKAYKENPTPRRRTKLEGDFSRIVRATGRFAELDEALRRMRSKRDQLLLVLDRPEIPLHNNLSEHDIRDYVKKRRISAGTRSDAGRRCRDTFLSLKKTCQKLGISFWDYLQDRVFGRGTIPALPEAIRSAALDQGG